VICALCTSRNVKNVLCLCTDPSIIGKFLSSYACFRVTVSVRVRFRIRVRVKILPQQHHSAVLLTYFEIPRLNHTRFQSA